jgi:broad specificity phosphatase PhoE
LGHRQARETGRFLDSLFAAEGIDANNVTLLSSPFLRCIQTSNELLAEFHATSGDVAETVSIKPEYSVFEYDLKGRGKYHRSLPSMSERKCYFPRLDENHKSLFTPSLPEDVEGFLERCQKSVEHLNQSYPYETDSDRAIIIVSHAAGCVGLAKAASGRTLQEINAAPPCGIYRLSRTSNSDVWEIDHFSKRDGMNGYSKHISDMGESTIPWNHFGDKKINNGFTGPPLGMDK